MLLRQFISGCNAIEEIYIVKTEDLNFTEDTIDGLAAHQNEDFPPRSIIGTVRVRNRESVQPNQGGIERIREGTQELLSDVLEQSPHLEHMQSQQSKISDARAIIATSTKCIGDSSIEQDIKISNDSGTGSPILHRSNECVPVSSECLICNSAFTSTASLKQHLRDSHKHMLPYKCSNCTSGTIRNLFVLNKHFTQHDPKRPQKCNYCDARFDDPINRAAHQRRYHRDALKNDKQPGGSSTGRYVCRWCGKRFVAKFNFERHERNHEMNIVSAGSTANHMRRYHCYVCAKQLGSKIALHDHLSLHVDQLPYRCEQCVSCKVIITSIRRLNQHLALHVEDKSIRCVYCEKSFITIEECQTHEKLSHAGKLGNSISSQADSNSDKQNTGGKIVFVNGIKRFQCGFCDNSYSLLSTLRRHENIHTGNRKYVCNACGKIFSKSSCLLQHERTHSVNAPYKCEFCGKGFKETIRLIEHRRIHSGEKPFACEHCSKRFRIKPLLKEHLLQCSRSGAPRHGHKCIYCEQTFSSRGQLVDHVVEGHVTQFSDGGQCRNCDLRFKSLSALVEHELQHRVANTIDCKQCGRIFKQQSNLRRHLRLHTQNSAPYTCDLCGKSFSQAGAMKVHRRIHTGERPYTCELCAKSFYHSSTMNRHKRSHYKATSKLFLFGTPEDLTVNPCLPLVSLGKQK